MWQRKQTLFLIGSLLAVIFCLLEPIGMAYTDKGIGEAFLLTNLGFDGIKGLDPLPAFPLFVFMAITGVLTVFGIFLYRNRKLQMKICSFAMLSDFLWYIYYAIFFSQCYMSMHIKFAACLPLISCIFLWLAKKGIKADDDLVKSMDRIR